MRARAFQPVVAVILSSAVALGWTPDVAAQDEVKLVHPLQDPSAIVLVSGRRGITCARNEVHRGWGSVMIPGLGKWGSSSQECVSDLSVFSTDHAMHHEWDPWNAGPDQVQPSLRPMLDPLLNIWVVSDDPGVLDQVDIDTAQATSLFSGSRVGVSLGTAGGTVQLIPPSHASAATIGKTCAHVYALRDAGPPLYEPTRINIYYVPVIKEGAFYARGYTCFEWGAPNVIYISLNDYSEVTLAHELGHAFGLRRAMGHTSASRFGVKNVMMAGLDSDEDAYRDHFTLGQAYRMNVDESSLLHRLFPGRKSNSCQDTVTPLRPCLLLQRQP